MMIRSLDSLATQPTNQWPDTIEHLSASSIKKFLECPDKWRKHYLLNQRETRQGYWLFQGSVNHRAIDWALSVKMTTGTLPSTGDVLEKASAEWDAELEKRTENGTEIDWEDKTPGGVKDAITSAVKVYHEQVSPTLNPISLEHRIDTQIPGIPIPLIGYIDIVEADRLIDRKETAQRARKPKPDWLLQAGIYTAHTQKPLDFHVTTRTKTPAVYTPQTDPELRVDAWPATRVHAYVRRVYLAIQNLYTTFGPDDAWPGATMHPYACDYCGLRNSCAWWE